MYGEKFALVLNSLGNFFHHNRLFSPEKVYILFARSLIWAIAAELLTFVFFLEFQMMVNLEDKN